MSFVLVERIYRAGRDKLRTYKWLAACIDIAVGIRDAVLARLRTTRAWQMARRTAQATAAAVSKVHNRGSRQRCEPLEARGHAYPYPTAPTRRSMTGKTCSLKTQPHPRHDTVNSGKTLLIVEDCIIPRHAVCDALRYAECTVLEAETGQEAIAILKSRSVDVLFVDMHLPSEAEGLLVASYARVHQPTAWLIVTTG